VVREGSEWAAHGEQKAAAELELAEAMEDEAWMREGEIGRAVEHQWSLWCCGSTGLGQSGGSSGCRR
jgi:hypothetical protein